MPNGSGWKVNGAGDLARVTVADTLPKVSSYEGDQTIDTTGVAFAFAPGALGIQIKVTHATQTIRVGMGATELEASANSVSAIPIGTANGIVSRGRRNEDILFYHLRGSGVGTDCTVEQI